VARHSSRGGIHDDSFAANFAAEPYGERILKISQLLAKLRAVDSRRILTYSGPVAGPSCITFVSRDKRLCRIAVIEVVTCLLNSLVRCKLE